MIASAELLDRWTLDEIAACDEGMALLKDFARTHTEEWKIVMARGLVDLRPQVIGVYGNRWISFADHCNVCEKCKEC